MDRAHLETVTLGGEVQRGLGQGCSWSRLVAWDSELLGFIWPVFVAYQRYPLSSSRKAPWVSVGHMQQQYHPSFFGCIFLVFLR